MPDHNENRGISLQLRDIEILKLLLESRVMTIKHASVLHFHGRIEATKKRILRLRRAGLISVRPRRPFEPTVLFLSRKGLQILDSFGHLPEIPEFSLESFVRRSAVRDRTLRHELEVMDVKAAFLQASLDCKGLSIQEFGTWPSRYRFHVKLRGRPKGLWIKPDGYIRTSAAFRPGDTKLDHFFLELDRSTESLSTLVAKCSGYVARRNTPRPDENFPFRVLLILKSRIRERNLSVKLASLAPPIRTLVWMTTFEQVSSDPLGAIWTCPVDPPSHTRRLFSIDTPTPHQHPTSVYRLS